MCARPIEHDARLGCDQCYGYACRRAEEYQGSFAHHHPRTFWPSFAAHHGPRVDGYPVLTELHVEYGLACTARFGNGRLGSAAHCCDWLARYHELPEVAQYKTIPPAAGIVPLDVEIGEAALLALSR